MNGSVLIDSQIYVTNPTNEMVRWAFKNLVMDNPEYETKLKLNKWLGNTPEHIYLFQVRGDKLVLPFGCARQFHEAFGSDLEYETRFKKWGEARYASNIQLYEYQQKAVESALKLKNGIIVMPCGSGKTQTAMEIIARLGGSVLWLTHTQDLLNQSKRRAEAVLETASSTGTITAGKVNCGTGITFATVQTMSKLNLSEYRYLFDIVIVDECQHCCGSPTRVTQFYKVMSALSARYKFGLTATPRRSDGLHKSMFALLGDIVHEVTREEVAETTCPVKVKCMETGYMPNYDAVLMGDGTLNYAGLVDDLINDGERFEYVADVLNSLAGATLVLANRVQYIEELHRAFNGRSVCLSTLGHSKKVKAERKEVLRKLNDGELDAVFATYQLAKEGLDVPNLRYVVFATPEKDETTIIQSAGRVGRKAEGKEYGTVIDFVDDFGMYRGWASKRRRWYRKIGVVV